jgi:putative transposase
MERGYKYELRLNNKERTSLQKCARTARFAWNWGLAERNDCSGISNSKGMHGIPIAMKQHKLLIAFCVSEAISSLIELLFTFSAPILNKVSEEADNEWIYF